MLEKQFGGAVSANPQILEEKMESAKKKKAQLPPREDRGTLCVSHPGEDVIYRLPRPQAYQIVEKGGRLHPRSEWRAQQKSRQPIVEKLVETKDAAKTAPKGKTRKVSDEPSDAQKAYWAKKSNRKNKKR